MEEESLLHRRAWSTVMIVEQISLQNLDSFAANESDSFHSKVKIEAAVYSKIKGTFYEVYVTLLKS